MVYYTFVKCMSILASAYQTWMSPFQRSPPPYFLKKSLFFIGIEFMLAPSLPAQRIDGLCLWGKLLESPLLRSRVYRINQ